MNTTPYIIEQANTNDIETIARFQVAMAFETEQLNLDTETVRQGVSRIFDEPSLGFYIVARDPTVTTVANLLILKEWSDWRNTEVWWIHSLYVSPGHRKCGVFRKMLAHVESLARTRGAAGIRLYVEKANTGAQKAYQNLGMSNRHYELFEKMF